MCTYAHTYRVSRQEEMGSDHAQLIAARFIADPPVGMVESQLFVHNFSRDSQLNKSLVSCYRVRQRILPIDAVCAEDRSVVADREGRWAKKECQHPVASGTLDSSSTVESRSKDSGVLDPKKSVKWRLGCSSPGRRRRWKKTDASSAPCQKLISAH